MSENLELCINNITSQENQNVKPVIYMKILKYSLVF